jgi:hypothetical protein
LSFLKQLDSDNFLRRIDRQDISFDVHRGGYWRQDGGFLMYLRRSLIGKEL